MRLASEALAGNRFLKKVNLAYHSNLARHLITLMMKTSPDKRPCSLEVLSHSAFFPLMKNIDSPALFPYKSQIIVSPSVPIEETKEILNKSFYPIMKNIPREPMSDKKAMKSMLIEDISTMSMSINNSVSRENSEEIKRINSKNAHLGKSKMGKNTEGKTGDNLEAKNRESLSSLRSIQRQSSRKFQSSFMPGSLEPRILPEFEAFSMKPNNIKVKQELEGEICDADEGVSETIQ